jgi:hypothetical protein
VELLVAESWRTMGADADVASPGRGGGAGAGAGRAHRATGSSTTIAKFCSTDSGARSLSLDEGADEILGWYPQCWIGGGAGNFLFSVWLGWRRRATGSSRPAPGLDAGLT